MTLTITDVVKRPDTGVKGRPAPVRASFFPVSNLPTGSIYRYDVDLQPAISQERKFKVLEAFFANEDKVLGPEMVSNTRVFDGYKRIFSTEAFSFGDEEKQFSVDLTADPVFGPSPKNIFQLKIKLANVINMSELQQFLGGNGPCTENCLAAFTLVNVLIKYVPSLSHYSYRGSIFMDNEKLLTGYGIDVWRGLYLSARPAIEKVLINIDVCNAAMHTSGPLIKVVGNLLGKSSDSLAKAENSYARSGRPTGARRGRTSDDNTPSRASPGSLKEGLSELEAAKLKKLLVGCRIKVNHRGNKTIVFKIIDIAKPANELTFTNPEGQQISVADYFKAKYDKPLEFPLLPCLVVQHGNILPIEVCEMMPKQRFTKSLNRRQKAEFLMIASQTAQMRADQINQGVSLLKFKESPHFEKFGLQVDQEMTAFNARVLDAPIVNYGETSVTPTDGTWNIARVRFTDPKKLASYSIVNFSGGTSDREIQESLNIMSRFFQTLGLNTSTRAAVINADPASNVEQKLKDAGQTQPQIIICILRKISDSMYAEIKRVSDTVLGIPSQCVLAKYFSGQSAPYFSKLCLKVNMKLGGINSHLSSNDMPFVSEAPTIVLGADINHPAPDDLNSPSIAAVTASIDKSVAQFASAIRIQERGVTIIADLGEMVKELLKTYYKKTKTKPARILFYRNHVSEKQFSQILSEVDAIRQACQSLGKDYNPTLTFLVIQRHPGRFFPIDQSDPTSGGNCKPGTVVDTNVVHPFEFDFYLQSHFAFQGTAHPAHYHVIHDDNNFTADALQQLTFNLCHLYGGSTSSVSIVPAAYYARSAASRARFYRKESDIPDTPDFETQKASFGSVPASLRETPYYL